MKAPGQRIVEFNSNTNSSAVMKNGVIGRFVLTLTPFLFAAPDTEVPNPVAVETLISSDQGELPF